MWLRQEQQHRQAGAGRGQGFARSEDGSLIVFVLFLLFIMFAAGGMGVDFMRSEAQRSRLQSTLDRAVLAAASLDQPLNPSDVVMDYFARAGLSKFISASDIQVTQTLTSRKVSATTSMDVGTTFLRFTGIDKLTVPAVGAAEESATQTEISLVLDVSGSMNWSSTDGTSKIAILRNAARQFVNIVLCDPGNPTSSTNCTVENGKVSVNLVPYSEQVLLDKYQLSLFNVTNEHNSSSCVTFDASDFSSTAISPTQLLKRTGHFDPWSSYRNSAYNWTCRTDDWRKVTMLGSDAATLGYRINALQAYGNTSIDVGMKWASGLLDPALQPIVSTLVTKHYVDPAYDGRPTGWSERGVEKVIVLMTDGVNTDQHYLYDFARDGLSPVWYNTIARKYSIYNASTGLYWWDGDNKWMDHPYGAGTYQSCSWTYSYWSGWQYSCTDVAETGSADQMSYVDLWAKKPWAWYTQFSWLSRPGSAFGNSTKNARLQTMCDAAKAENITVFTVGFEVTSDSGLVLKNCASSPAHYFDVQGLDLTDAFAAIARQISKLRLVN